MIQQQVHESELLIPALKIIEKNPNINTTQLKNELEKVVRLYPKDKEILKNRSDSYFSQTVRNLCGSHLMNNKFGKSVDVIKDGQVNCFSINKYGMKLLLEETTEEFQEVAEDECYQKEIENASVYDEEMLELSSNRAPQLSKGTASKRYKTDAKLAKTVLMLKEYKCENASLLGVEHKTFISKKGVPYQEGHHLVPIKAQKDFEINIDRPENIICLCPICHRAVHNACREERIVILKRLYDDRIEQLEAVGIVISFEDLYNKYYL